MSRTRKTIHPVLMAFWVAGISAGDIFSARGESWQPLLAASSADNPGDAKAVRPILFPDGVIDPELRTAFVSSPKGGIQAIRLDDGKTRWTNDDVAAQPWLAAGQRLIARGDGLCILDLDTGKLLRQCTLEFPKVDIPERCTVSFPLWDPIVSGDTLTARWYAVAHIDRTKGRPFPFQAWTAFNKSVPVGTVKIDLETRRVVVHPDPKPADVTAGLIPEAANPAKRLPAELADKLVPVWQHYFKDENGRIVIVDGRVVGVSMTLEKIGQEYVKRIDLNSWDPKTGAAAETVQLVKDKAIIIANIVLTEDRRHAGVVFSNSALTIWSLASGKLVAKDVKGVSSPEKAFVDGKRLYFTQLSGGLSKQTPNTLKAVDLESGKVVWERALKPRSTVPLPP